MSLLSNVKGALSKDERILTKSEMKNIQGGSSYGYSEDGCSIMNCGGACFSDTAGGKMGVCVKYMGTNGYPICKCSNH